MMLLGFLVCLDSCLFSATILPLRCILAMYKRIRNGFSRFVGICCLMWAADKLLSRGHDVERSDFLRIYLSLIAMLSLHFVDVEDITTFMQAGFFKLKLMISECLLDDG